jgi:DNA primase
VYYRREVIDQVRMAASLLELAGELTTLRPIGSRHYGLCPFHKDTTASFSVDPKRGLYYCHGCQKGGDVFAFYRQARGVSFNAAVEDLAKRFGVLLPPPREVPPIAAGGVLQAATDFYAGRLLDSSAALDYLEQRGIPLEVARLYRLGYAGAGWQDLLRALEPSHTPEALLAKGLIARSEKGNLFDRLRNRIVFPVTDAAGRTAGFASRSLDPLHSDYRFTPGTRRRYLLFGLREALLKLAGGSEPSIFVVEGFFDVLALAAANAPAVGAMSNQLTEEQTVLLSRHVRSVTLFPDHDKPGLEGMAASLARLLSQGLTVAHVLPPPGEDPASFLRKEGAQALSGLEIRDTLLERLTPALAQAPESPAESAGRMSDALRLLSCIPDPTWRIAYAQHAAKHLGLPAEILLRLLVPDLAKRE